MNSTIKAIINTTTKCTKHLKPKNDVDAASVDHSHHSMPSGAHDHDSMGMSMSFHFGFKETILFDFWTTDSITLFIFSCCILFLMAALYEGLKLIREKLIRDEIIKQQQIDVIRANTLRSTCNCGSAENRALLNGNGNNNANATGINLEANDSALGTSNQQHHDCCKDKHKNGGSATAGKIITQSTADDEESKLIILKSYRSRLLSQGHLIQTFLHMFQITVSYLLMLVFMTYNTWLCLSVVLGAGFGYFIFGLKRLTTIDVNEHCH